jgi:hypothetical protein
MRIAAAIIVVIATTGSALRAQSPAFEVATVNYARYGAGWLKHHWMVWKDARTIGMHAEEAGG